MTTAVILAGGAGTRLMEETVSRPKPMVEIGGRPILWHIMKIYAAHGITDFVICLGYKGFLIKEYFANYRLHAADVTVDLATGGLTFHRDAAEPWTVTLVDTGETTQTGGRLKRIARYLPPDQPFCMTYGDGVGAIDIGASLALHRRHGKLATVTAVTPPGRFGALTLAGDQVVRFGEKPAGDGGSINGGFFVLDPRVLDRLADDDTVFEQEPLEGLAGDGELVAMQHDGFWMPMDTMRDRAKLEELWSTGAAPWKIW
jgi:glucose-1-phosphate cytidylyltransferase